MRRMLIKSTAVGIAAVGCSSAAESRWWCDLTGAIIRWA